MEDPVTGEVKKKSLDIYKFCGFPLDCGDAKYGSSSLFLSPPFPVIP
jgi:hypothetical protein